MLFFQKGGLGVICAKGPGVSCASGFNCPEAARDSNGGREPEPPEHACGPSVPAETGTDLFHVEPGVSCDKVPHPGPRQQNFSDQAGPALSLNL